MTERFLSADVSSVLSEIDSILTSFPELKDDTQLRVDMLEGSTAAFDVLTRLVNIERDADSMSKAIAVRVSELQARKTRAEKRKEMARALMLKVMQAAGIQKAPLAEATVSVSKGRAGVDVVDVNALPDALVRVERVPDKKAIMERLAANENVPGAVLREPVPTVTVRVA